MVRDWQLMKYLEDLFKGALQKEEEVARQKLNEIEAFIQRHLKLPFTVYDPTHGEIQIEQYLPIPVYSLDVMPVIDLMQYLHKYEHIKEMIPDRISLPNLDTEIIPPFTGTYKSWKYKT